MKFVVAIDGTASSGKSTTAKLVAKKLGFTHLDTGAMYRAVTHWLILEDAVQADDRLLQKVLINAPIEFKLRNRKLYIYLRNRLLRAELRSPEVDQWVSPVAEKPAVRAFLVAKQRRMGARRRLVCEGRDIGSVVFPDADLKVFMCCDLEERARRRKRELEQKGICQDLGEVRENLINRDKIDSTRKLSPLICTPDALCVDTTELTINQQVQIVEAEVSKRMGVLS